VFSGGRVDLSDYWSVRYFEHSTVPDAGLRWYRGGGDFRGGAAMNILRVGDTHVASLLASAIESANRTPKFSWLAVVYFALGVACVVAILLIGMERPK
jgi:hypothetical protein